MSSGTYSLGVSLALLYVKPSAHVNQLALMLEGLLLLPLR